MSVIFRLEGEVGIVTLARPEKFNSVSAELSRGLIDAIARAGSEARALILTGEGRSDKCGEVAWLPAVAGWVQALWRAD